VLFCDMKGIYQPQRSMTPQGLVKVMNHYLSTMSEPILNHHGIIDKYIGGRDHVLLGLRFNDTANRRNACLAAIDMARRGMALRTELPELLGVRRCRAIATSASGLRPARCWSQHRLGIHDELPPVWGTR